MSGAYLTNIARPTFIPLIGKQALKALATSALDSAYLNEKASLAYDEKSNGVTEKAHLVSLPFTQADIAKTLNSLLAFAKFWLTLPNKGKGYALLKEVCLSQNKALIIKPELAIVKAASIEVALPVTKDKPLTAQRLREILDVLPEVYGVLKGGRDLLKKERHFLTGKTSQETTKVNQLLGQYKGQLKPLEMIMRQGWYQAFKQEKTNALASATSLSCFTDEQVDTLTEYVNDLSTFSTKIIQSSKSLCEVPSHENFRFIHGVAVSLAYLAGSTALFCMGVSLPVIGVIAGLISVVGGAVFFAYGKHKKAEVKKWTERINTLTNFTEQLKNIKGAAMATNLSIHGTAIKQQGATLSVHGQKLVAAERKVEDLEAKYQQLIEMNLKLMDEVETLKKDKVVEGQSKVNEVASPNSKHEAVRHCC